MDPNPSPGNPDKRVAEAAAIKTRLFAAGLTCAAIDRRFKLPDGTCRNAMREPNPRGERAIASALGTLPHLLWRTRYRPNGERRSPQDWSRVPTLAQRRKAVEART